MTAILDAFATQMKELQCYREKYGTLDGTAKDNDSMRFIDEGSDTEQEA